ncbi:hypothetical protein C0J52_26953 [Blattella germanica]|nr:hypothetical protein C0J52_26953 [Blattella germanica]
MVTNGFPSQIVADNGLGHGERPSPAQMRQIQETLGLNCSISALKKAHSGIKGSEIWVWSTVAPDFYSWIAKPISTQQCPQLLLTSTVGSQNQFLRNNEVPGELRYVVLSLLALATAKPGGLLGHYAGPYAAPYAAHFAAPYAAPYAAAPLVVAHAAPVAVHHAVAPVAVGVAASTSSQHHAQDTLGHYGYADRNSQKQEVRTADGVTRGGYSYVDGHGIVQSASYVADGLGFRVAATNLPVGPAAPAAPVAVAHAAPIAVAHAAPIAVAHGIPAVAAGVPLDTPEVAAAKAAHFAAHADAVARNYGRKKRSVAVHHAIAPAAVSYAAAPVAVHHAAPVAVAHAAPVAVAHAAPIAVAAPVYVEPVKSFGYSTATVHADPVVVRAPVAVAHAAPVAVAHAAPVAVAHAAPVAVHHAAPVAVHHAAPLAVVLSLLALATAKPGGLLGHYAGPYAAPYAAHFAAPYAAAPLAVAHAAPVAVHHAVAPVAVGVAASTSSQHHAQDTLGQYSYGYADRNSQKQEVRTADGVTRGGYSYVDGHGIVQSASYVADGLGFRVAATNLPVGPAAPAAPVAVAHAAPIAVAHGIPAVAAGVPLDTPEVAAAKAAHFAAHAQALSHVYRKKRSLAAVGYAAAPVAVAHAAPFAVAHAAPVAVAAPVYVEPVRSFGYSTATAHADPVVVPARVAVAHAAPLAVAHAAPLAVAHAAPVAAIRAW